MDDALHFLKYGVPEFFNDEVRPHQLYIQVYSFLFCFNRTIRPRPNRLILTA